MKKFPIEYVEARKKYMLFKNDCGVTDMTRRGGVYEHYIFDYIRDKLDVVGKTIIDVGANFGHHTLEFADLVGDTGLVHAFEPQLYIYYQLCGNIMLNGYANIRAHNYALSNEFSNMKMENLQYFSEETINIGDAHLGAYTDNGYNMIDVVTLDSFNYDNVAVLKIDVQGYEPRVLEGARETILRNQPVIFIEVEAAQLHIYGWQESDIFTRLDDLGYTYQKTHDAAHLVDYVAIPKI